MSDNEINKNPELTDKTGTVQINVDTSNLIFAMIIIFLLPPVFLVIFYFQGIQLDLMEIIPFSIPMVIGLLMLKWWQSSHPSMIRVSPQEIVYTKRGKDYIIPLDQIEEIKLDFQHNGASGGDIITTAIEVVENSLNNNPSGGLVFHITTIDQPLKLPAGSIQLTDFHNHINNISSILDREPEIKNQTKFFSGSTQSYCWSELNNN